MAIRIQRDVGGNLADTLRTTAGTLREREVAAAPGARPVRRGPALGLHPRRAADRHLLLHMAISTGVRQPAVDNDASGLIMCAVALVLLAIGIVWMRRS